MQVRVAAAAELVLVFKLATDIAPDVAVALRCADGCFSVAHSFVQVRVAAAAELVLVLLLLTAPYL